MNKNAALLGILAAGAGALYLFGNRRRPAVDPRKTTGTAKAPVNTFDQLFASRAQQPIIGGASGGTTIGASIDLTGIGKLAVDGLRKLFGSSAPKNPYQSSVKDRQRAAEGKITSEGLFSTQADYDLAIKQAEAQEQDYLDAQFEYDSGVSQDYGGGGLEAAYGSGGQFDLRAAYGHAAEGS